VITEAIAPVRQINLLGLELIDDFKNPITRGIVIFLQPVILKVEEYIIRRSQPKPARRVFRLGSPNHYKFVLGD
jgi:hypothetical protein